MESDLEDVDGVNAVISLYLEILTPASYLIEGRINSVFFSLFEACFFSG